MGRIVTSTNISIDGIVQDPAGDEGSPRGGWVGPIADRPELGRRALVEARDADAFLFGRRTFAWMAARWPTRTGQLAERLSAAPKYVVSSTLRDPSWSNTTVLAGEVVDEVAALRQRVDGDVVVPGSGRLVRLLVEHGLVDELRLVVFPLVLGDGTRLFGPTSGPRPLHLLEQEAIGDGLTVLRYGAGGP